MTYPETRTARTLDLPLGPGRETLRLALLGPGNDEGAALVLCTGFGGGGGPDPFTRPPWAGLPMRLPAEIIPQLRTALEALEQEEVV